VNSQRYSIASHVIAAIGSIIFLSYLPVIVYFAGIFLSGDVGGPFNLIIIPCANCTASILLTAIFFLPLSKLLDWLFQKINRYGQRKANSFLFSGIVLILLLGLVISGFTFAMGLMSGNPYVSWILGKQNAESVIVWLFMFLFYGGVPFLLGGVTYWFLLQASRKLLSYRKGEQILGGDPKSG
jgi:hypothetical protein